MEHNDSYIMLAVNVVNYRLKYLLLTEHYLQHFQLESHKMDTHSERELLEREAYVVQTQTKRLSNKVDRLGVLSLSTYAN